MTTPENEPVGLPKDKPHKRRDPSRCPSCGEYAVVRARVPYDAVWRTDERLVTVSMPSLHVRKCAACFEMLFDNTSSDEMVDALLTHLKLLTPFEIVRKMHQIKVTLEDVAGYLGIDIVKMEGFLNGCRYQTREEDNKMRLFFEGTN